MRAKVKLAKFDFGALPMMAVAATLIGVSALFSATFGLRLGEPSGTGLIFLALALAIDGYAAFALPTLWPRLRLWGRVGLVALLVPFIAFKLTAAHRFASENLGQREAVRERQVKDYRAAEARVTDLRGKLKDYADARPVDVLEAKIAALLRDPLTEGCTGAWNGPTTKRVCPEVDRLRAEKARAEASRRTQQELQTVLAKLDAMPPVAAVSADASGPVPWLLGLFGYSVGSFAAFCANLVLLIVEAGSVAVPAMIGFARKPRAEPDVQPVRKPPAPESAAPAESSPKMTAKEPTDSVKRASAELIAFLGARTDRAAGEKVQSTQLYAAYTGWKQGRGGDPMTVNLFGTTLTHHLGLEKVKRGGVQWYMNISLRSPEKGAGSARHLQPVSAKAS